jgi:hypothetical protein
MRNCSLVSMPGSSCCDPSADITGGKDESPALVSSIGNWRAGQGKLAWVRPSSYLLQRNFLQLQFSFILAALLVKGSTVVAQILDCSSEMTIRYVSRTF